MTPIVLVWTLAAGSFLTMAVIELVVAAIKRETRVHIAFSLVALAAMGGTLTELAVFGTASVPTMTLLIKAAVAFNIAAHLALIWFVTQYTGVRLRPPGWVSSARWC